MIRRVVSRVISSAKKNKATKTEAKDMATTKMNKMIAEKGENQDDYKTTVGEILKRHYK